MTKKTDILKIYFHSKNKYKTFPETIKYHHWLHIKTFFDTVCYLAELEDIP
ncbi:MAG: hypothetical protein U9P44_02140 [archaeon]|nr:hypothetical protein [archaeon]